MMSRTGLLSAAAAMVGLLGVTTSCIFDSVTDDSGYGTDTATVGINVRMMSNTGTVTDIQTGTVYENYVGDYRIYFFTNSAADGNDTFIAQFNPSSFVVDDQELYTTYSVFGKVPDEMIDEGSFKVVVLANWESYPTPTASTKIEDLCAAGTFTHKSNFTLGTDNLIPMYGVHEYSGITFRPNYAVMLDEPINLLRAMAKVEVVLDNSDIMFDSVVLHRYNDKGYCAPSGIYKNEDYVTYYSGTDEWEYKYGGVDLHLIDDENDTDTESRTLDMQFALNDSGKNTWYCYVPEYANMNGDTYADDYAYIQVNLSGYEQDLAAYRIYFRGYDDGTTTPGADYDIGRNVLYRFTVTMTGRWLNVHVDKWEDSFWNDFTFNGEDE